MSTDAIDESDEDVEACEIGAGALARVRVWFLVARYERMRYVII